jgi:hypothetical protein
MLIRTFKLNEAAISAVCDETAELWEGNITWSLRLSMPANGPWPDNWVLKVDAVSARKPGGLGHKPRNPRWSKASKVTMQEFITALYVADPDMVCRPKVPGPYIRSPGEWKAWCAGLI